MKNPDRPIYPRKEVNMKKSKKMYWGVYIGAVLFALTLIIFFVPNSGTEKSEIEYAKLAGLLVPEAIMTFAFLFLAKKESPVLSKVISFSAIIYFALNAILVVILTTVAPIIVTMIALLIVFAVIFILMLNLNSKIEKIKNSTTKQQEPSKLSEF